MTEPVDPPEQPVILLLTVGGSHQPLRTAIRTARPAHVVFIVSEPAEGVLSSETMADALAGAEGMPAGRAPNIVRVPADDPDTAHARILSVIDSLRDELADHHVIADYTGGTKSMSAALLMAALSRGLDLQVMVGLRRDLRHVMEGSEAPWRISPALIQAERELDEALSLAREGSYGACATLVRAVDERLRRMGVRPTKAFRKRLAAAREWANCLAAWDAFDHTGAWRLLDAALGEGRPWAEAMHEAGLADILRTLADNRNGDPRWELAQDLVENARRRLAQGRFEDAIARLYRAVEACGQARLFTRHGLRSDGVPPGDVPDHIKEGVRRRRDRTGREALLLPLDRTMRLLEHLDRRDPVARAYLDEEAGHGPNWLGARNNSILAHGFRVIERALVDEALEWIETRLLPASGLAPMAPLPAAPAQS